MLCLPSRSSRSAVASSSAFVLFVALFLLLAPVSARAALEAAPGDTASVVTLQANFDADTPNAPPNLTLPGAPAGDFLTLDLQSGTVRVVPSYDGLSRPVEIRQVNDPGVVAMNAHAAATPFPAEDVTVRWRSVARDDEAAILIAFAVRASNGATLASVEYLHQGALSYNGAALPVTQATRRAQQFTIGVDFLTRTTSLRIDGVAIAGFQSVPFAQQGDDVTLLSSYGTGGHPQTVYVDDISMVARYRVPDHAPIVSAPTVVDGEEGGVLQFTVGATDADGDALSALAADLSSLPPGNAATFTPDAGNASGTFRWPMAHGEAGSYLVTFTASNASSGSAETKINVAFAGTTVTGELIWTPQPGEEGTYSVTFTATNSLNESGSSLTTIIVTPSLSATTAPSTISPDSRTTELAPSRINKGPIVSSTGLVSTQTKSTLTVSATATEDTSISLSRALGGLAGSTAQGPSGIVAFNADLSDLPPGNNAIFTLDQEPLVSAPSTFTIDSGVPFAFTVSASDPDGDALLGLTAGLNVLPAGNTATFTPNAAFTSGTFSWTPRPEDAGTFAIEFTSFNALVGKATTSVTVREVAPARVFMMGNKRVRLSSNRPIGCLQIEPVNASFSLLDIDLMSIRMVSTGTGVVSEIAAGGAKSAILGDRDNNQIEDLQVCFTKADMRLLFSFLRGQNTVPVLVRGRLYSGARFQGSITLDIVAGGGALQTVLAPNPLNPSGMLSFITKTPGAVRVSLFDLQGRFVRRLWESEMAAPGGHEVPVEARGADGRALSSGVYFYRIETRDGVDTGRFTVLK